MPQTLAALPAVLSATFATTGAAAGAAATAASLIPGVGAVGAGLSLAGTLSIGSSLLASVAVAALQMGVQAAFSTGRSRNFDTGSTTREATISEPARRLFFGFGRIKTGGNLAFWQVSSAGDLWRVIVYDCQKTEEIEQHFINQEPVTLDDDGWVQTPTKWQDIIRIKDYQGTTVQAASSELVAAFPGVWTSAHQGKGLSYVVIQQKPVALASVSSTYPNGARGEQWTAIRKADNEIYDPRDGSTGYSDNLVLCLLRVLTHPQGGALSLADFSLSTWRAAADLAGTMETTPEGGQEARYRAAGLWEAAGLGQTSSLMEAISGLLRAGNAMLYEDPDDDGKIAIALDLPEPSRLTAFTADDVLDLKVSRSETTFDRYDATNIKFVSPAQGFTDAVSPHYPPDVASPQRVRTIDVPFCPSHSQAGRLAKMNHLRLSSDSVTASLGPIGLMTRPAALEAFDLLEIRAGSRVLVTDYQMGPTDQPLFEISGFRVPAGYGEFSPADELEPEELFTAVGAEGDKIAAPSDLRAGIDKDDSGTLRVSWGASDEAGIALQYEVDIGQTGTFMQRQEVFPQASGAATLEIDPGGASLVDVRARFSKLTGGVTDWADLTGVSATTPVAAPTAPTLSVLSSSTAVPGGGGIVQATIRVFFLSTEGVHRVRIYEELNTDPPTELDTSHGVDGVVHVAENDTSSDFSISRSGAQVGDDWNIMAEIIGISNEVVASAVTTLTITSDGGS